MVRFSCFNPSVNSNKPKRSAQGSVETMDQARKDKAEVQISIKGDSQTEENGKYVEPCWKPEEMKIKLNPKSDYGIKKSQSLGAELFLKGRESDEDAVTGDEISCDISEDHNRSVVSGSRKDLGGSPPNQYQKDMNSMSLQVNSDIMRNGSIFSIDDPYHSEKEGHQNSDVPLYGDCFDASGYHTPQVSPKIARSRSLPIIDASSHWDGQISPLKYSGSHSRSCKDLHTLDVRLKNCSVHDSRSQEKGEEQRDNSIGKSENDNSENHIDDGCDSSNYFGLAKDWIVPDVDEGNTERNIQGQLHNEKDELPTMDFKIKRIEEWVDSIQHYGPLEDTNEHIDDEVKKDSNELNDLIPAKAGSKISPGMEAAKRYISSLSATASTAQLANHGLAVIPLLSAFSSLRVLNLSGNSIVRITAGALPRGLHSLNLSKNSISTIEGLRDLTRLRVLNLSYNRIVRIGHGLASCSSLKELYLAGNKLSEVEGLHRLLKLSVLDLRFNKISTAKCLGQLAANYNSLQAISLEGNPAQKNVGDDHLKKHLQSLLPNLVYYNRQPIKSSSLKDAADRSVRLGINSHQLRLDHKSSKKSAHGASSHRPSSSSHGQKSHRVAAPLPSVLPRGKRVPLPPTGNSRHHHLDNLKALSHRPDLSMRRSRSESQLGVF